MNYALAKEVRARILAEPKAVNMNYFCEDINRVGQGFCGTVGCISGHAVFASGITAKIIKLLGLDMEKVGRSLLEISNAEAMHLFYFFDDDKRVDQDYVNEEDYPYIKFARQLRKQRPGTERYAKIVANALDYCMYRHQNGLAFRDPE